MHIHATRIHTCTYHIESQAHAHTLQKCTIHSRAFTKNVRGCIHICIASFPVILEAVLGVFPGNIQTVKSLSDALLSVMCQYAVLSFQTAYMVRLRYGRVGSKTVLYDRRKSMVQIRRV
jgi:hypothetical protein